MAGEFRRSFDEMARQAELDELRKEIDDLKKNNPISAIGQTMNDMQSEIDRSVNAGTDGGGEAALEAASAQEPPVEGSSAPRAGEFDVTGDAPAGDAPARDAQAP
jgi:sec-independent protein translocase protein TatB